MLIRLLCAHEMSKHVCKISRSNSKRLLRKLQKILGATLFCRTLYTKWCAHTFQPIFLDFRNFWPQFCDNCGANKWRKWELCMHLNEQSLLKQRCKPRRNRTINGNAMLVRTMHPSNARCSGLEAWQTNKKHIFAPTAGAHCAIFSKLCMVIEPIIKGVIHFWIQRIVFRTRCTEKFGLIFTDARFLSNNSVTCDANQMKFETLM